MKAERIFRSLLFVLFYNLLISCGSIPLVQEVPSHLKPGKLYLAPKTIEVRGRQFNAEEGFIVVNENPSDFNSRKNMLPVLRIFSLNKNPKEPIFWLNGGPGLSNMKYRPLPDLLEDHDFVLVGYRGVDGSVLLKSDEIEDAMEGDGIDLLGDNSIRLLSEAIERFSNNLKSQGIDISRYTMVDVISDFETARSAFGYDKINLFSVSYGTRLAIIYSYLHPDVLFRSVMIGVNPPGRFVWSPQKIDQQLQYYDRLFAADSNYNDGRLLSQSIKKSLSNMPSRWSLFKLDPGKIRAVTFAMLYHKSSAAIVFHCYRAAEEGDYSGLYILQRAYDFTFPSSLVWGDAFAKGNTDYDSTVNYIPSMRDSATVMGSPFSLLIWGSSVGHWPIQKLPPELSKIQPSDIQTLLISGSLDFSSPAEYATDELLPSLRNGKQIILKEMGHVEDLLTLQRPALTHLLFRFYNDGIVDDSKFVYDRMDFNPAVNLPMWSKVLYPFVFILSFF
jgi:pimeloyl-ACP methyl ester carboxylesterase